MRSDFSLKNNTMNVDAFRLFVKQRNRRHKSKFWKFPNFGEFQLYSGTNPIRRDSFVRTDQSQTSLAGKYCEI